MHLIKSSIRMEEAGLGRGREEEQACLESVSTCRKGTIFLCSRMRGLSRGNISEIGMRFTRDVSRKPCVTVLLAVFSLPWRNVFSHSPRCLRFSGVEWGGWLARWLGVAWGLEYPSVLPLCFVALLEPKVQVSYLPATPCADR